MKNSPYLIAGLVATVICGFAVPGTGQQTPAPGENGIPAKGAYEAVSSLTAQQTRMRRAFDAHTAIVPWLLEQAATGNEQERGSAIDALYALAPIAASPSHRCTNIHRLRSEQIQAELSASSRPSRDFS